MKKQMMLLMLLGVLTLESCSTYRIQIIHKTDRVWYTPMYKPKPLTRWREHYSSFYTQEEAEQIIKEWKETNTFRENHKKPKYIYIN